MKAAVAAVLLAASVTAASAQMWPWQTPPLPLQAREVKFPPYEIRTLPNGLQVVAVLHHEQPVVSMRMIVRSGTASDPKGKNGLAELVASLLDQGTATKSAKEINEEVDFMGAILGAGAGTDFTFLSMIVMKDGFDTGLRMLSDVARRPAFDQVEIERQREQALSGLRLSFEDPGFLADTVFTRLVYGFHPYGMPGSGTPETLASLTRDDLVAFHNRVFVPNNAILAIVGDVTAAEAFDGVQKVFGDWQRRELPPAVFDAPPEPTRRVVAVNKPDSVQTEVRVGHLGIKRNHPDYMALNLAIRILGGEGANRLHQVLRSERSLTYGAQAKLETLKETGDIEAETNTRSAATGEVLRLIVDEFWRIQRERVSNDELSDAKAYMTGSFPLSIETPDAIATQVMNTLFYGLPVEQLETYRERVNAVTPDDVQRVARLYLRPDRLSVVVVGDVAAFKSQLAQVGFGTIETIESADIDLAAPDFKRAKQAAGGAGGSVSSRALETLDNHRVAYQLQSGGQGGAAITAQEGRGARALLDEMIGAKGGLDKLKSVKTIHAVGTTSTPDGVQSETTTYILYPNHVRVEVKTPAGMIVQAYDGVTGWLRDAEGLHDAPASNNRETENRFKRDGIAMLLAARDGSLRTRLLPDVKGANGNLHHALEVAGTTLEPTICYVDPATNLLGKVTYFADGAKRSLVEELFGDYRAIDGIQVAFTAQVRRDGVVVLDRRLTSVRINNPLDPALFRRPVS